MAQGVKAGIFRLARLRGDQAPIDDVGERFDLPDAVGEHEIALAFGTGWFPFLECVGDDLTEGHQAFNFGDRP